MGLAKTGTKAQLSQMGLELGLNLSLEDFPGGMVGGGGWSRSGNTAQLSWGLSLATHTLVFLQQVSAVQDNIE